MKGSEHISLADLNARVKQALQVSFPKSIWVVAEIGQLQENMSGHCYLDLIEKDENTDKVIARNKANIWAYTYRMLKPFFETSTRQTLSAGLKVMVNVSVEYHELYGISLNIKDIDPAYTVGEMALKKQQVINQLKEDGVLEMNSEFEFPALIKTIAIISSSTAAGYGDFMDQINDVDGVAFHTCLYQAVMQGDGAPDSIIAAFDRIYEDIDLFDAVVVIRGGGASLDMSCFDDYNLAYYASQFPLPIIAGIGHERDESVLDLVVHTSLKTPTAVAAFLVQGMESQLAYVNDMQQQIIHQIKSQTEKAKYRLNMAAQNFPNLARTYILQHNNRLLRVEDKLKTLPNRYLEKKRNALEYLEHSIVKETPFFISTHKNKLKHLGQRLRSSSKLVLHSERLKLEKYNERTRSVDPENVLKMGYSLTTNNGKVVKDASILKNGDKIETRLKKGTVASIIKK